MSLPYLPSEIWERILDFVVNSEDSDLSHVFSASLLHKGGRYFRLDSIEFGGLNDPKRVLISLNGKNPLSVHVTNLKLALSALLPYLHQTRRVRIVRLNELQQWKEVFEWFGEMINLSSLIIQNCDVGNCLMNCISQLPLQAVSFLHCTANAPYETQEKTRIRGISFFECTPLFTQRVVTRLLKFGNEIEEVSVQINNLNSPPLTVSLPARDYHQAIMTLIRIKEKECSTDSACWRSICGLLQEYASLATLAIHITDKVDGQAQLLEVLAQYSLIAEHEYYTAFDQLLTTSHATVSFGRMCDMHRIFVNGELCTDMKSATAF